MLLYALLGIYCKYANSNIYCSMTYSIQIPSQLSSHLKALRKAKGLSQVELGAQLGLSQARIARIEGDPLSISVEQLLRVLAALGHRMSLEAVASFQGVAESPPPPYGTPGEW
jgi:HTH-type transcriptional regulator / antitoxin HipB